MKQLLHFPEFITPTNATTIATDAAALALLVLFGHGKLLVWIHGTMNSGKFEGDHGVNAGLKMWR